MLIRKAQISDAREIARNIMAALEFDIFGNEQPGEIMKIWDAMTVICEREDTLYSWKNTIIADDGGVVAGSLSFYNGSIYKESRDLTFSIAYELAGWTPPEDMEDETGAGECYLDSLAVHPEYRRQGIARLLIDEALEIAKREGSRKAGLIVLSSNEKRIIYYKSFGFVEAEIRRCFGHDYLRMERNLD